MAPRARLAIPTDTADPAKAKFYRDIQEKLTATSADLLFFREDFQGANCPAGRRFED